MSNNANSKKSISLSAIVGTIAALVTIADCIYSYFIKDKFEFSIISIIGISVVVISVVAIVLTKYPQTQYVLKKNIRYYTHKSYEPYFIESKESSYVFLDRNNMEHNKKHRLKSKISPLTSFTDKFSWSKALNADEIKKLKIVSNIDNHKITHTRFENWIQYTVNFDGVCNGAMLDVDISIKDLKDPNRESLPFLSSNVTVKTKQMLMSVVFQDKNIYPKKIQYKIFNNYAATFPIITKELKYDIDDDTGFKKIEHIETKPIPGYRYVITWKY